MRHGLFAAGQQPAHAGDKIMNIFIAQSGGQHLQRSHPARPSLLALELGDTWQLHQLTATVGAGGHLRVFPT